MKRSRGVRSAPKGPVTRTNEAIRVPEVRLIGADGKQMGIVPTREALKYAEEASLDLVEVSANSAPPVCKLIDYGKYKYIQQKQAQEAKKKNVQTEVKEINLTPNISENDLMTKIKHIEKWLEQKNRIKISVRFRGREMAYKEYGYKLLERVSTILGEKAQAEGNPRMEGRRLSWNLLPNVQPIKKK
jgi:translation initiation factor IF-3